MCSACKCACACLLCGVLVCIEFLFHFPNGEYDDAYVFLVENPHQLTIKFPVEGQHKTCKLCCLDTVYFCYRLKELLKTRQ